MPTEGCGEVLTDISGWITSPDLDKDGRYDFNLNCTWIIEVDERHFIEFRLLNLNIMTSEDCSGDRLSVSIVLYCRPQQIQRTLSVEINRLTALLYML